MVSGDQVEFYVVDGPDRGKYVGKVHEVLEDGVLRVLCGRAKVVHHVMMKGEILVDIGMEVEDWSDPNPPTGLEEGDLNHGT